MPAARFWRIMARFEYLQLLSHAGFSVPEKIRQAAICDCKNRMV
jgi:hypothetical protein